MPVSTKASMRIRRVSAIKKRLASEHAISHATVEPEYGACADDGDDHDHDHAHDAARITTTITSPID